MSTSVALLRAVNVGGQNRVGMSALRDMFAALGFPGARTLLHSGNVVFDARGKSGPALERILEDATKRKLSLAVDYVVRSAAEWEALVRGNPFATEAKRDPARVHVVCLKRAPAAATLRTLEAGIRGREVVRLRGRELYAVYPDGMGRSKLTNTVIERLLGTRGTARNWNTVLKLAALVRGGEGA